MKRGRKPSYGTYLQKRADLLGKGYRLDAALGQAEYEKYFKAASDMKMKNIAREMAYADITISRSTAKNILNQMNELKVTDSTAFSEFEKLFPKHKTQKDIMTTGVPIKDPRAKTERQQLFFDIADILGSVDKAKEFYGY